MKPINESRLLSSTNYRPCLFPACCCVLGSIPPVVLHCCASSREEEETLGVILALSKSKRETMQQNTQCAVDLLPDRRVQDTCHCYMSQDASLKIWDFLSMCKKEKKKCGHVVRLHKL